MAKVGKLHLQVDGSNITYELHYKDDVGFFAKDFPVHIRQYMLNHYANSKPVNKAETKDQLKEQLQTVLHDYNSLTAKKKHVILIRIGISTQLHLRQKDNEQGGSSWDYSNPFEQFKGIDVYKYNTSFQIHNKIPYALGLDFKVGYLVETETSVKFHRILPTGNMAPYGEKIEDKEIVIDYTDDRKAFLDYLLDALRNLAANLFKVITDADQMQKAIQQSFVHLKLLQNNNQD